MSYQHKIVEEIVKTHLATVKANKRKLMATQSRSACPNNAENDVNTENGTDNDVSTNKRIKVKNECQDSIDATIRQDVDIDSVASGDSESTTLEDSASCSQDGRNSEFPNVSKQRRKNNIYLVRFVPIEVMAISDRYEGECPHYNFSYIFNAENAKRPELKCRNCYEKINPVILD